MMTKSLPLIALLPLVCLAQQANWTGLYEPCLNSAELRKTGRMSIGVRYDISDRVAIQQFNRAFAFWARILDADFHEEHSTLCAIAIVDGSKALLPSSAIVARAQLPDKLKFQGWIAIDPRASTYLADDEAVAIWIHEIGHLLGLQHNTSPSSVMYWLNVDASSKLDLQDICEVASRHALRPAGATQRKEYCNESTCCWLPPG